MKNLIYNFFKIVYSKTRDGIFIVCLLIASALWLLAKLNKTYVYEITLPVVVTGAVTDYDKKIIATENKVYNINTDIEGQGFELLRISLIRRVVISPDDIIISKMTGEKDLYQIDVKSLKTAISDLFKDVRIIDVNNKIIALKTVSFSQKKVKLYPNITIGDQGEYMQLGTAYLVPDSVMVYGTKKVIDTITRVYTEHLEVKKANSYLSGDVKIALNNNYDITPRLSEYFITMERYTELNFVSNITILNQNDKNTYTIIPDKINVTYNIAANLYSTFDPSKIKFYIDPTSKNVYDKESSYLGDNKFMVRYSKLPIGVEVQLIEPAIVNALINK